MCSKREVFSLSGPVHLTVIDWENVHHRRSFVASLVKAVYILELDRQQGRVGPDALAAPWWEFFQCQLLSRLHDDTDGSIFGAIFEYRPKTSDNNDLALKTPRYVIAFRGTITKPDSASRDFELNLHIVQNGLHQTSRFEISIQAVRNMVASVGDTNIWLAGHSLGSAMAMLAGKMMAKNGIFLEAFLFNPPFFSAPIEKIKDRKVKHGIRIASSIITAGLTFAVKKNHHRSANSFSALSAWVPRLFVHPVDHISSEYIGYFEHRKKMEEIGAGSIERLATQNSLGGLLMNAFGKDFESEPVHLIPSAVLTVNRTPASDFKQAHGIHQWWSPDLHLQSCHYKY